MGLKSFNSHLLCCVFMHGHEPTFESTIDDEGIPFEQIQRLDPRRAPCPPGNMRKVTQISRWKSLPFVIGTLDMHSTVCDFDGQRMAHPMAITDVFDKTTPWPPWATEGYLSQGQLGTRSLTYTTPSSLSPRQVHPPLSILHIPSRYVLPDLDGLLQHRRH